MMINVKRQSVKSGDVVQVYDLLSGGSCRARIVKRVNGLYWLASDLHSGASLVVHYSDSDMRWQGGRVE